MISTSHDSRPTKLAQLVGLGFASPCARWYRDPRQRSNPGPSEIKKVSRRSMSPSWRLAKQSLLSPENLSRRAARQMLKRKSPGRGTTGASAALPACRSDRRMCIVGGRNDATAIMRQFSLGCNLYLKINHECAKTGESQGRPATQPRRLPRSSEEMNERCPFVLVQKVQFPR